MPYLLTLQPWLFHRWYATANLRVFGEAKFVMIFLKKHPEYKQVRVPLALLTYLKSKAVALAHRLHKQAAFLSRPYAKREIGRASCRERGEVVGAGVTV